MKLILRTNGDEPAAETKELIERCVHFGPARFGPRVRSISVHLRPIGLPANGRWRAQIIIRLKRLPPILGEETGDDVSLLMRRLCDRASRAIVRMVARLPETVRLRP